MEIKNEFRDPVSNPKLVANIASAILDAECPIDQDKEHFWVFGLNLKLKIKYIDLVSLGTLTESLVHPREVFRFAVMKGVASIILVHNHPGGESEPSPHDLKVTINLSEAGKILKIEVLDHIIIGKNNFYSFGEHGLFK
jgi:DNA repair protein RadC